MEGVPRTIPPKAQVAILKSRPEPMANKSKSSRSAQQTDTAKPSHIAIENKPVIFFEDEDRLLVTPGVLTLLQEDNDEMHFDMTHESWLDQLWECIDDVVRMLGWRDISTKPIHVSRCLVNVKDADDADFLDARHVLYRNEPTDAAFCARREEVVSYESSHFLDKKDEFANDEQWCVSVADSFSHLLATLAIKKIAMNVFAFLELLAVANKSEFHTGDRKIYLQLVGFELYTRASIAVLRGEEVW